MSVCYYLICKDCKKEISAASLPANGVPNTCYDKEERDLEVFIVGHHKHSVAIISEHEMEEYGDIFKLN